VASKISLTVAVCLFALSSAAVASTAHARSHLTAAQAGQSYNWAAPASVGEANAHRYHGGPKSND
jgi:ABC-type oligopeptide transport system substrate-binding subunit